jgi:hypothetical protein
VAVVTRPVVVSVAAVFAGLAWLLASFPDFDASVLRQLLAVVAGGALGGVGTLACRIGRGDRDCRSGEAAAEVVDRAAPVAGGGAVSYVAFQHTVLRGVPGLRVVEVDGDEKPAVITTEHETPDLLQAARWYAGLRGWRVVRRVLVDREDAQ